MIIMNRDLVFHQHQQGVEENMSNLTSASCEASVSSGNRTEAGGINFNPSQQKPYLAQQPPQQELQTAKKKRNQPGNPDPEAEVIALTPKTLLATNRFVCEICNKGFQRDQNLQLHRRGHNLPWKLKRANKDVIRKKVYVCPEPSCVHHDPLRALGDLTGIKKHFCRKHGEKKWKCDKCSKKYAVLSDWKAHSKTCGTREYRCDCGTVFSRRDSFITHRAFCDALAKESARTTITAPSNQVLISSSHHQNLPPNTSPSSHNMNLHVPQFHHNSLKKEQQPLSDNVNYPLRVTDHHHQFPPWLAPPQAQPQLLNHPPSPPSVFSHQQDLAPQMPNPAGNVSGLANTEALAASGSFHQVSPPHMSATALLQKAAQMGSTMTNQPGHLSEWSGQSVPTAMGATITSATAGFGLAGNFGTRTGNNNNPSLIQDYLMNSASGFGHGGSFDETFGGFLRTTLETTNGAKNQERHDGCGGRGGGGEDLTRDFLGLRPLSRSDILSFAGLENCINAGSNHADNEQQQHSQSLKQWQG